MGESTKNAPANLTRPLVLVIAWTAALLIILIGAFLVFGIIRRQMGAPIHGEAEIVQYGVAIAAGIGLPVVASLAARWSLGGLLGHVAAAAETAMWIWLAGLAIQSGLSKIEIEETSELLDLPIWIPLLVFGVGAALAAMFRLAHSILPSISRSTPNTEPAGD